MKKWILFSGVLFLLSVQLSGQNIQFPGHIGWVNDFADVISKTSKVRITILAKEVNKKTGVEMILVTLDSVEGFIDNNKFRLFQEWGIGKNIKGKGILFLLTMKEQIVRIEVGYGLKNIFPDSLCEAIVNKYTVPDLRNGNYGEGLYRGVMAVAGIIAKNTGVQITDWIEPSLKEQGLSDTNGEFKEKMIMLFNPAKAFFINNWSTILTILVGAVSVFLIGILLEKIPKERMEAIHQYFIFIMTYLSVTMVISKQYLVAIWMILVVIAVQNEKSYFYQNKEIINLLKEQNESLPKKRKEKLDSGLEL